MAQYKLKTNPLFRDLIRPLSTEEYRQLETNLRNDGCREPIAVWNDYIVDGHNRYEICTRLGIPFKVVYMYFESNEDAVDWICSNQLGRRNISEETRKYLIGKRYEAEKIIGFRKYSHEFDHSSDDSVLPEDEVFGEKKTGVRYRTAQRLGQEYHLSHSTVQKYGKYSRAVDEVGRKEPALVPAILSGRYKISHENLVELASSRPYEVKKVGKKIIESGGAFVPFSDARKDLVELGRARRTSAPQGASIKDMPEYDPDAEVTGLTLTIPTWSSSIERIRDKTDLTNISPKARDKLKTALSTLQQNINVLLECIKGDKSDG